MKIGAEIVVRSDVPGAGHVSWHPESKRHDRLWAWDGRKWIDPIAQIETQITDMIEPYLARAFAAGYEAALHGLATVT